MKQVLRYTEELEKVGFSTEQARKSVQLWMDLMDQNFATKADFKEHYFMTKADLKDIQNEMHELCNKLTHDMKNLEGKIQSDMKSLEGKIQSDLKSLEGKIQSDLKDFRIELKALEHTLTVRLGVMMAASIGIVSAIISLK